MSRRVVLMLGVLASALPLGPAIAADPTLSGYVRSYGAVSLERPHPYNILQNTLQTEISVTGESAALKASPFVYQYLDGQDEFGLRQVYVDVFFDAFDLRLGKQQIIWGKADGVFITDIVSPKDLSEFLLRDFEEIRQGVTALKANYYLGENTLELVLIPGFTPTRQPAPGSIWRPAMDLGVPTTFDRSREEVPLELGNGEVFLRFSTITSVVDFELIGGYMWDDDSSLHLERTVDPATRQLSSVVLTPIHHRVGLAGGSLSTTVGGIVIRGEGAWYRGRRFATTAPTDADGLVEKDELQYLLGVDRTVLGIRLSGQVIQELILDHDDALADEALDTTFTLLASVDLLRETLQLNLFAYVGLNAGDALVRPKVSYTVTDGLVASGGVDLFLGDEGRFGQFSGNDMGWAKLKYSF